jgi:hypothetical protein
MAKPVAGPEPPFMITVDGKVVHTGLRNHGDAATLSSSIQAQNPGQ